MADGHQEPDPGHGDQDDNQGPWHPPNQNAAIMAEATPAVTSRGHRQAQNVMSFDASQIGHGYVAVGGQFDGTGYQDLRSSFSGTYQISGGQQDLFQAAHSTYGRMTPPNQNAYVHQDQNDSEAIPAYSTIATDHRGQIITASTVDSSSLQQGYIVLDHDHNMMTVQRVVSPADCTVSQSTLGMGHDSRSRQSSTLITMPSMSTGSQYVVQVPMSSFSSQEEVSTSSTDQEAMNSLGAALRRGLMGRMRKPETTTGECDTTQEDLDCQPQGHAASYLHQAVSLATDNVGMESGGLHSTMMAFPRPVAATVTSADLAESADIDSSQLSSLQNVPFSAADLASAQQANGGLGAINCQAMSLEEAMVSASDVAESSSADQAPISDHFKLLSSALASAAQDDDRDEDQPSTSGIIMVTVPTTEESHNSNREQNSDDGRLQHWFGIPVSAKVQTRKSSRLAQIQEQEKQESRLLRQPYEPRPYEISELWCEECQQSYDGHCSNPAHRLNLVSDKPVLTRAWATCPSILQIFRITSTATGDTNDNNGVTAMGVYAKRGLSKFTQFGPFTGDLVDSPDKVSNKNFLLKVERDEGTFYYDTQDEDKCNWMIFVRPAESYAEQNMVAYQHGQEIYFSVIKNIDKEQELKVWYAAHYAEHMGLDVHELTESDLALLDEQASRFQCSTCYRRFRTNATLVRHLMEHDMEEATAEEEKMEEEAEAGGKKGKGKVGPKTYHLLKNKPAQEYGETSGVGYQWKKKSTNVYLNGSLKKYNKKTSGTVRQTIKSLYRRRGRGIGGQQEWVCTHCNLTFDNPNVLNLHTLTHAAEDVGLEEIQKLAGNGAMVDGTNHDGREGVNGNSEFSESLQVLRLVNGEMASVEPCLACPVCRMQFSEKRDLIEHAAEHGKARRSDRPFKCQSCWKCFSTKEKLQKHLLCHGDDSNKPFSCEFCNKRFMTNSALACHLKTHSQEKYYTCPICHEGFDHKTGLKQHVNRHADASGRFMCHHCQKPFDGFLAIRKHMRSFHSDKQYVCKECHKDFPRPDKLKLHMLRHTSHREFMCETCGRQFKRKDKLKEHIKRIHMQTKENIAIKMERHQNPKKFIPKVAPTDYQRFIYKCHECLLGFKRRGMLVNHLNKRHPGVSPDTVHELNLPILKQQRDYYCQLCDKVYKSSSKRKAHILKNHPGAPLPPSARKKPLVGHEEGGVLNADTFSQSTHSITTFPHRCELDSCHKQYASKAKLLQHQRKQHPGMVPAVPERRSKSMSEVKADMLMDSVIEDGTAVNVEQYVDTDVIVAQSVAGDMSGTDVLTQAMTEIFNNPDFRTGSNITIHPDSIPLRSLLGNGSTVIQVQGTSLQPTTIELSTLQQALNTQFTHTQIPPGATLIPTISNTQMPVISAQPINISVMTNNGQTIPVSIHSQAFVPRTWTTSNIQTYQQR